MWEYLDVTRYVEGSPKQQRTLTLFRSLDTVSRPGVTQASPKASPTGNCGHHNRCASQGSVQIYGNHCSKLFQVPIKELRVAHYQNDRFVWPQMTLASRQQLRYR